MADNKQYITQIQEHGTIMISEEVVAVIVTQAIKDVEGVVTSPTPSMFLFIVYSVKN